MTTLGEKYSRGLRPDHPFPCRPRRNDVDDRHRQQRRHDPHAEADRRFHQGQSGHHAQLGDAGRKCPASESDTDIATKAGQFDVLTIGTYEVPIWGKKGWLVALEISAPTTTSTICCLPSAPA